MKPSFKISGRSKNIHWAVEHYCCLFIFHY